MPRESGYHYEETFERIDFRNTLPERGEYEHCSFIQCDFSGVNLSGFRFIDCTFNACNLSLAKLGDTTLSNVTFDECKLLGLHFEQCSSFALAFRFRNCILNHASFYKVKAKATQFQDCQLHETDFTEADLTSAVFERCDLHLAHFERTILEKADLRTAYNYTMSPEDNRIKKARFSLPAVTGLLHRYDIRIEP